MAAIPLLENVMSGRGFVSIAFRAPDTTIVMEGAIDLGVVEIGYGMDGTANYIRDFLVESQEVADRLYELSKHIPDVIDAKYGHQGSD